MLQIRGPHKTLSPDIGVMGHQVSQSFVFTLSSGLGNVKNIDGLWWWALGIPVGWKIFCRFPLWVLGGGMLWNLYNECSLSEDLAGEKCKNFQESTYQLTSTNLLWDRIVFFASLWCVMLLARLGEVSLIDTKLRFGCFSFVIFCFVCLLHP